MKMRTISAIMAGLALGGVILTAAMHYNSTDKAPAVHVVESDQLTTEELDNRYNKYVVVEHLTCTVLDNAGNAVVTNTPSEPCGGYIKFPAGKYDVGAWVDVYLTYANTSDPADVESRIEMERGANE